MTVLDSSEDVNIATSSSIKPSTPTKIRRTICSVAPKLNKRKQRKAMNISISKALSRMSICIDLLPSSHKRPLETQYDSMQEEMSYILRKKPSRVCRCLIPNESTLSKTNKM